MVHVRCIKENASSRFSEKLKYSIKIQDGRKTINKTCKGRGATNFNTRMHSSRMRTSRSSSCLLGGGGGLSASVHAGIHPWAWTSPSRPGPPPPRHRHGHPPLGWAWTPQVWAWTPPMARPPNPPLGPGPRHPPPRGQTDRCKNKTLQNFVCER